MVSAQGLWSLSRCLLTGIQSRGRDAAGYAYIRADGNTNFAKSPVEARDFIKIPGHLLHEVPKQMPTNMLLHARYATVGAPSNNKNNHPLYSKVSGLCMIHNGWFVNDSEVKEQFSLKSDAEVDTEIYLRLIEKFYIEGDVKSIETAIKEATKCVYGSIACGMIQGGKPNVMWLWRDLGDLYVIKTEWGYVFASTNAILFNAIGCLSTFDLARYERFHIPQSTLVKLELGKKPKFIALEPVEWNGSKHSSEVYTTTINGEEKLRRIKKSSGGTTTYYYGNYANFNNGTNFGGYHTNKGLCLPGVSTTEPGETNGGTQKATDQTKPQRPKTHHIQCQCRTCAEWWEWQIEHDNAAD
jgi:glucosamine 6-phosphate synthetase-like amidotransferase/phosphosugar isomerase protein